MTLSREQWQLFTGLYSGYFILYIVRKSFSYASPLIMVEENLEKNQLGMVISCQMVGYSISKFFSGVVVDSSSPTKIFSISLFLTGITAVLFTKCNSVFLLSMLWFFNGLSQGPSWPSCAILLKRWFPAHQFGTWWSALSSAMNLAGSVGPLSITTLVYYLSWRMTFTLTGSLTVCISVYIILSLSDNPSKRDDNSSGQDDNPSGQDEIKKQTEKRDNESNPDKKWSLLVKVLKEPVFIGVCCNYLLISFIRGGCNDWGQLYLIQDKQNPVLVGSLFTSSQEIGGLLGALSAGSLSDYLLSKERGVENPRLKVLLWCVMIPVFCIFLLLFYISSETHQIVISLTGFGVGFGVYGAIALFGVIAMESAPKGLEGTAHSVAALAANVGIVLSGYPLSLVAKVFSWHVVFIVMEMAAILTVVLAYLCRKMGQKSTVHIT